MNTEKWVPVAGYVGLYEVSDLGRVKALARSVRAGRGNRPANEMILSPIKGSTGYMVVSLCKLGIKIQMAVHLVVLRSFVGPRPLGLLACHGDGNANNNALSNLRWDTHANNVLDRKRHGTDLYGERAPAAKLTDDTVRQIRKRDKSIAQWSRELGVSLHTVYRARSGETWGHIK